MHGWFYGYGGSWLWWLGPLLMVIFWGLVIAGGVFLIRWLATASSSRRGEPEDSALEILKKRYAKDEIGKEEFEEKKRILLNL